MERTHRRAIQKRADELEEKFWQAVKEAREEADRLASIRGRSYNEAKSDVSILSYGAYEGSLAWWNIAWFKLLRLRASLFGNHSLDQVREHVRDLVNYALYTYGEAAVEYELDGTIGPAVAQFGKSKEPQYEILGDHAPTGEVRAHNRPEDTGGGAEESEQQRKGG